MNQFIQAVLATTTALSALNPTPQTAEDKIRANSLYIVAMAYGAAAEHICSNLRLNAKAADTLKSFAQIDDSEEKEAQKAIEVLSDAIAYQATWAEKDVWCKSAWTLFGPLSWKTLEKKALNEEGFAYAAKLEQPASPNIITRNPTYNKPGFISVDRR